MVEQFDPYYKWLGISPQNQPPDLYRLLALERFETDPEVIEAAVNRQMTYVQSCATGPYIDHSQKLLNEIAAARLCLLDARRKAAYDAQLREKLVSRGVTAETAGPQTSQDAMLTGTVRDPQVAQWGAADTIVANDSRKSAPPPAPPRPKPAHASVPFAVTTSHDPSATRKAPAARHKRELPVAAIVVLAALAVGAVAAAIIIMNSGGGGRSRPLAGTGANQQPAKSSTSAPAAVAAQSSQSSAAEKEGDIVAPGAAVNDRGRGSPEKSSPAPAGSTPQPADNSESQFKEAEKALAEKKLDLAEETLRTIANDLGAAKRQAAFELLAQLTTVISNDWGRAFLRALDNTSFEAFEQGRLRFTFPDVHPALQSVAIDTLRRVLPEIKKERMPGPPPPVETPTDTGQNPIIKPQPAGPVDPAEYLKALGLKRFNINVWVVPEEARCETLVEQAKQARVRQSELTKDLAAAILETTRTRLRMQDSENAVKKAENTDTPARGTPERAKIEERAAQSRSAYDDAKKKVARLKQEKATVETQETDAMAEARRVATAADDRYRGLRNDRQVSGALDQLKQRLGPSEEFEKIKAELLTAPRRNGK